jgi:hypothetical protein
MNGNCEMTNTETIHRDEETDYNHEKNRENILAEISTSFDAIISSRPIVNIFDMENVNLCNIKSSHQKNQTKEGRTKNTHIYTHNNNNNFANECVGTISNIIEKKKKGRKTKKPNEKEIMMQYSNRYGSGGHDHLDSDSNNNNNDKKRKPFDSFGILSTHERNEMEKRMTMPINEKQQE